jgi:hypothetical protein
MKMTLTQYADHRGVQMQAVQYAVKRGRIKRAADGTIDSEQADRDWEKNTLHTMARYGPKGKNEDPAKPAFRATHKAAEAAAALQEPERQTGAMNFNNARTIKEVYEAKLKKLEHDERLGTLINKRDVEVAAFNRFRVLRDALMNVPVRMAAQLAAEPDPAACHELLEAELRIVLEEFSGGKLG